MSIEARFAAAKGIDACPMCGSVDVRWRRRRPTDFIFTAARYVAELFASVFSSGQFRDHGHTDAGHGYFSGMNDARSGVREEWRRLGDGEGETLEGHTSHETCLQARRPRILAVGIFTLSPCRRRDIPHTLAMIPAVPLGD